MIRNDKEQVRTTKKSLSLGQVLLLVFLTSVATFLGTVYYLEQKLLWSSRFSNEVIIDSNLSLKETSSSLSTSITNDNENTMTSTNNVVIGNTNDKNLGRNETIIHKPLAILHVGPHKIATTSIQYFLSTHYNTLLQDNFVYIGKVNQDEMKVYQGRTSGPYDLWRNFINNCIHPAEVNTKNCQGKAMKILADDIEDHRKMGRNIVASAEEMARIPSDRLQLLKSLFNGFDVKIVVGYRRYHELLRSTYNEMFKRTPYRKAMRLWKEDGGLVIPSFGEFATTYGIRNHQNCTTSFVNGEPKWCERDHPTKAVMDLYRPYFDTFGILNIHNQTDIVEMFSCNLLPNAIHTCKASKSRKSTTIKNYKDVNQISYERIVQYLHDTYKLGSLSGLDQFKRAQYRRKVQLMHYQFSGCPRVSIEFMMKPRDNDFYAKCKRWQPFPEKCLSQNETKELLRFTEEFEAEIVPEFHNNHEKESMEDSFRKAEEDKIFCWADIEKLFQNYPKWKRFAEEQFAVEKKYSNRFSSK